MLGKVNYRVSPWFGTQYLTLQTWNHLYVIYASNRMDCLMVISKANDGTPQVLPKWLVLA